LLDPAMYLCLYGFLWSLRIQKRYDSSFLSIPLTGILNVSKTDLCLMDNYELPFIFWILNFIIRVSIWSVK
jgi:hypothetical protein